MLAFPQTNTLYPITIKNRVHPELIEFNAM